LLEIRVTSPEELVDTRGKWIEAKRADLLDLQRTIAVYDRQLARLRGQQPESAPAVGESDSVRFRSDGQWNSLNQSLEEDRLSMASAAERLGPKHPTIEALKRSIASRERQIRAREDFLTELSAVSVVRPRNGGNDDDMRTGSSRC
jgi:uncharacterized protein involved in exopolysaccharide biosynthesis